MDIQIKDKRSGFYEEIFGASPDPVTDQENEDTQITSKVMDDLYRTMDDFMIRRDAISVIWRCWVRFKQRKIFLIMKQTLHHAEHLMTVHLIKLLTPKEAEFLMDPTSQCRVRFRLGGNSFPPTVYYKIFTTTSNVHYFSGKRIIEFGSVADEQAVLMMGSKTYVEAMLPLACYVNAKNPQVSEHYEVTTRKEYIQYLNSLDERPAYIGGRNNHWRPLPISTKVIRRWTLKNYLSRKNEKTPGLDGLRPEHRRSLVEYLKFMENVNDDMEDVVRRRNRIPAKELTKRRKKAQLDKMRSLYGLDQGTLNPKSPDPDLFETNDGDQEEDEIMKDEFEQISKWASDLILED